MKISGIYAIVNTANGNRYVGSSQDVQRRFKKHKQMLRRKAHHNIYLQHSWDKHGESCFEFVILEECKIESLLDREQSHLDAGCEYNIARIAGSPMRGRKFSPEAMQKMKEKKTGSTRTRETRERMSIAAKGKVFTLETREKMSIAAKGKIITLEQRRKTSEAMVKIWAARKGK